MNGLIVTIIIIEFLILAIFIKINNKYLMLDSNLVKTENKLYMITELIAESDNEDEVMSLILESTVEMIPDADKGSLLVLEGEYFKFKKLSGYADELKNIALHKEEVFLYQINNFTDTAIINDPEYFDKTNLKSDNIEIFESSKALTMSRTMCAPLYVENVLFGVLNVDCMKPGKKFTREDLKLVNAIRSELEAALTNFNIQKKLRGLARFDELTGLLNRRGLRQAIEEEFNRIRRYRTQNQLVIIDLDNFKHINDNFGHKEGDNVLSIFSGILKKNLRGSDIIGRASGDEFAVLMVNASREYAIDRMNDIRRMFMDSCRQELKCSFSFGIAQMDPEATIDEIMSDADMKMYLDKVSKKASTTSV